MESTNFSLLQKNHPKVAAKDVFVLCRKRYLVALMVFLGMAVLNMLGAHFGIVMVEMTTPRNVTIGDRVVTHEPEFKWTQFEKGALMGCNAVMFVFGFLGGMLAKQFGGTRIFGVSICIEGICSIMSPFILKFSLALFFVIRMLEGLFQIIAFGSFLQIFMKWAPSSEKFRMTDFAFSGVMVGVMMTFPICGVILENFGWQYVFYLTGAAAVLWYILWAVLIYEDPICDKYMLEDEKYYIIENVEAPSVKVPYPWKKILTSKAVWAYLNEKFVEAWSISFSIQCLPLYIKDSFDISISQIGFISGVPHILNFLGILAGGPLADFLCNKNILSSSKVYIFLISIGQITSVILFLSMGFWKNFVGSIICLCLLRFSYGFAESVYLVLPIDIAGEFASLVHGLGYTAFAVGTVLNPILMSVVVPNQSAAEWRQYFILLSLFNVWALVIFYFYGSGRPEPWTAAGQKNLKNQSHRVRTP